MDDIIAARSSSLLLKHNNKDVSQVPTFLHEGQPLVLDHFGHTGPASSAHEVNLCRLLDSGRVWVKLSPTRVSKRPELYDDLAGLVSRLVEGWPDRCLWGSDWPHVMTPPPVPRLAPMLDLLRQVLPESRLRAVLQDNPAALYRF